MSQKTEKEKKKEQKELKKEVRKLEKSSGIRKRKPKPTTDASSITIGGPVLTKATNGIAHSAAQRPIPEGYLLELVKKGDFNEIQRLKFPPDELTRTNKAGQTALHLVCQEGTGPNGGLDIIKHLIHLQANFTAVDIKGWTPLHTACSNTRSAEFVTLLGCCVGDTAGARSKDNATPLHYFARIPIKDEEQAFAYEKALDCLIKHGAEISAQNNNKETPLHSAVMCNNKRMVAMLVARGAVLDLYTNTGFNVLQIAVMAHAEEVIKQLVELGMDPKTTNGVHPSPYDIVRRTRNRSKAICDIFGIPRDHYSLLLIFGAEGRPEDWNLEKLKAAKYTQSDANEKDATGLAPLHLVAHKTNADPAMVKFLLDLGADIDILDDESSTPLHIACQGGSPLVADYLLQAGADITKVNKAGHTAIQEFILGPPPTPTNIEHYEKALDSFIARGVQLNTLSALAKPDETVLHMIKDVSMLKLFIGRNGDVNTLTKDGKSLLEYAIKDENKEIVELLLEKGVDPRVKGPNRVRTPLQIAKQKNGEKAQEIYQLLEKTATKLDMKNMSPEDKKKFQRQKVIDELVETEKEYNHDLEIAIKVYYLPIKQRNEEGSTEPPLLTPLQITRIFGNLEELKEVSDKMYKQLSACQKTKEQLFGQLFLDNIKDMQKYERVCLQQTSVDEFLNQALFPNKATKSMESEKSPFLLFCEEAKQKEECRKLPVGGFLIKPFQRITKIPLLLRELQHFTDESHPDFANLTKAREAIDKIIGAANEKTKNVDSFKELLELQNRLDFKGSGQIISLGDNKSRVLVMEGDYRITPNEKEKPIPLHIFLFNDIVIVTRPEKKKLFHFQFFMSLALCDIEDLADLTVHDGKPVKNAFIMRHIPDTRTALICSQMPEEKTKLLTAIKMAKEKLSDSPDIDAAGAGGVHHSQRLSLAKSLDVPDPRSKIIAHRSLDIHEISGQGGSPKSNVRRTLGPRDLPNHDAKSDPSRPVPAPLPSPRDLTKPDPLRATLHSSSTEASSSRDRPYSTMRDKSGTSNPLSRSVGSADNTPTRAQEAPAALTKTWTGEELVGARSLLDRKKAFQDAQNNANSSDSSPTPSSPSSKQNPASALPKHQAPAPAPPAATPTNNTAAPPVNSKTVQKLKKKGFDKSLNSTIKSGKKKNKNKPINAGSLPSKDKNKK